MSASAHRGVVRIAAGGDELVLRQPFWRDEPSLIATLSVPGVALPIAVAASYRTGVGVWWHRTRDTGAGASASASASTGAGATGARHPMNLRYRCETIFEDRFGRVDALEWRADGSLRITYHSGVVITRRGDSASNGEVGGYDSLARGARALDVSYPEPADFCVPTIGRYLDVEESTRASASAGVSASARP